MALCQPKAAPKSPMLSGSDASLLPASSRLVRLCRLPMDLGTALSWFPAAEKALSLPRAPMLAGRLVRRFPCTHRPCTWFHTQQAVSSDTEGVASLAMMQCTILSVPVSPYSFWASADVLPALHATLVMCTHVLPPRRSRQYEWGRHFTDYQEGNMPTILR